MVSQISLSGPSCADRDIPMTRCEDQSTIGHVSRKKKHLRTEGDGKADTVQKRGKKKRMNNLGESSGSSSLGITSFEASVTTSNLREDALVLPQHLTSSSGFKRRNSTIIITDGGETERSWKMNLRFNKTSDTFCMERGWRHFCAENDKEDGSSFKFELIRAGDTPLLSFKPTEPINDRAEGDKSFVDLKFWYDSDKSSRLYIPLKFLTKNGLGQPRMVTLVGKDGTRTIGNLLQETTGRMSLGKGWKPFTKANGLVVGDSFTLEVYWKKGIPMLGLSSTKSGSHKSQRGENSSKGNERESVSTDLNNGMKVKNDEYNIGESSNSSSHQLVTLAFKPEDVKASTLYIPRKIIRGTGIVKFGRIAILGKNQMKYYGYLLAKDGTLSVDWGWRSFCEANGVNVGDPFSLELIDEEEDKTPVYMFSPTDSKT